jgi:hypothetical protein
VSVVKNWVTGHGDKVEVWHAPTLDEYRWRVRAANGEIVGSGEGHPELSDAVAAAERHHPPVASEE